MDMGEGEDNVGRHKQIGLCLCIAMGIEVEVDTWIDTMMKYSRQTGEDR